MTQSYPSASFLGRNMQTWWFIIHPNVNKSSGKKGKRRALRIKTTSGMFKDAGA
jgi:hypothetical protein